MKKEWVVKTIHPRTKKERVWGLVEGTERDVLRMCREHGIIGAYLEEVRS